MYLKCNLNDLERSMCVKKKERKIIEGTIYKRGRELSTGLSTLRLIVNEAHEEKGLLSYSTPEGSKQNSKTTYRCGISSQDG